MFENVNAMLMLAAVTATSPEAEEKVEQTWQQHVALQNILSK